MDKENTTMFMDGEDTGTPSVPTDDTSSDESATDTTAETPAPAHTDEVV